MGRQIFILGPDVPYRPIAGLASLFARTGTGGKNPRAPHARSRVVATSTYVEVTRRTMENGGAQGGSHGNQQRGGGAHRSIGLE